MALNDSYPDPDALYEQQCEWWDYSVYDYTYREWDGDNPFDDDDEEEDDDNDGFIGYVDEAVDN